MRGRGVAAVAIGLVLYGATPACALRRLFVTNAGDDTVSVIDADTDREVTTLKVGRAPWGIALRVNGQPLGAVANSMASDVTLFDPVTLTVGEALKVGRGPEDVAFSRDGRAVLATSYYDKTIAAVDVTTKELVGKVTFAEIPRRVTVGPDGRIFVLLHDEKGAVAVVSPSAWTIESVIPVGPFPIDMALSADGSRLVAASFDASRLTTIDTATLGVVATHDVESGTGIALHPVLPRLYSMRGFDAEVAAYDFSTRAEVAMVAVGEGPVRGLVTPDGTTLYVVNEDANNVVKVDTATNAVLLRIGIGSNPHGVVLLEGATPGRWASLVIVGLVLTAAAVITLRRAGPRR